MLMSFVVVERSLAIARFELARFSPDCIVGYSWGGMSYIVSQVRFPAFEILWTYLQVCWLPI